ncbi:MAG: DMT family transporter [Rickettsiaceae bacterium]|nr:DMT family transporter [Rickettsiaceae bacterium]MDP5020545.1 DMT family transporter [Rickettsiaceae bacterium]MDP5083150.1 DMT family transporter [Rickettsiaceae bacterium]
MNTRLRSYFVGVSWFILSLFSSSINDVISKYAGIRLHSYEITFFRFMFGTMTLLPFVLYYGTATLKTSRPMVHFFRGFLLFLGIAGWTYGLTLAPVTTATVVSFMVPIFVLILGVFFLSENIIWQRWVVTIVAFSGLVITLSPNSENFNPEILIFVASAMAFAILDIINKKFVIKESMISMLFYSAIVTALLALPFALQYWLKPTMEELALLFVLGASANLILFFLLKAFAVADATALAPYRYFELIVSAIIAYIVFNEIPTEATLWGALIIIPSTLFIIYSEKKELSK